MKADNFQDKNVRIEVEITLTKTIVTFWDKRKGPERFQTVYEFEAYGEACSKAFDLLVEYIAELKRME